MCPPCPVIHTYIHNITSRQRHIHPTFRGHSSGLAVRDHDKIVDRCRSCPDLETPGLGLSTKYTGGITTSSAYIILAAHTIHSITYASYDKGSVHSGVGPNAPTKVGNWHVRCCSCACDASRGVPPKLGDPKQGQTSCG